MLYFAVFSLHILSFALCYSLLQAHPAVLPNAADIIRRLENENAALSAYAARCEEELRQYQINSPEITEYIVKNLTNADGSGDKQPTPWREALEYVNLYIDHYWSDPVTMDTRSPHLPCHVIYLLPLLPCPLSPSFSRPLPLYICVYLYVLLHNRTLNPLIVAYETRLVEANRLHKTAENSLVELKREFAAVRAIHYLYLSAPPLFMLLLLLFAYLFLSVLFFYCFISFL